MQVVPLADVPAQTLAVQLAGQSCQVTVYQKSTGLYCDLAVNNSPIITGVVCENLNRIVRDLYLGFAGDLVFLDTDGVDDPVSPGLGTRFLLCFLEVLDLGGKG
jgi:hypothetical protein